MAGLILAINSCNKSELVQEELLKSSAGYDELIQKAETWYIEAPEENSFPVLAFADELKWNQAMVHDVDTAFMIEVPIKLKNRYGLTDKNDKTKNVEQRMLFWYDGCDFKSYLELIVSTDKKENLQNIKKINFGNKENGFTGSFVISDISGKNINVWNYTAQEDQAVEMKIKSMLMICVWLVWYDEFGNITEYIDLLYCYPIGGDGTTGTGGTGTTTPDSDAPCPCEPCPVCGGCLDPWQLKSIPKPGEGDDTETELNCPMCPNPELHAEFDNHPCLETILNTLMSGSDVDLTNFTINPTLTADILNLFDMSNTVNLNIKVDYIGDPAVNGRTTHTSGDNYEIVLNTTYVNSATDLSLARTMIHEIIHANLLYKYDLRDKPFNELVQIHLNSMLSDPSLSEKELANITHHTYMANNLIPIISNNLYEWCRQSSLAVDKSYCDKLSWGGLNGVPDFEILPNKYEIENLLLNEKLNNYEAEGRKCRD